MSTGGTTAAAFTTVRDVFTAVVDEHPGTGAALAVWRGDQLVVDLWGGWRDTTRTLPWNRDTIVQPYSVSKPFVAVCVLLLAERGLIGLDEPMSAYWPGFTAPATVRQVLSHQAGIIGVDEPAPTALFYDWDAMCARLAAQRPHWPPGTDIGEAALVYGHLCGELVRRVDGRTPGAFLREEVAAPRGLDVAFGLDPSQLSRAADLTCFDRLTPAPVTSLHRSAMENPPGARDPAVVNGTAWRAAEIPAVNLHGTARDIARFYALLAAGDILAPASLDAMTTVQHAGVDRVVGLPLAWGLGLAVDDDGFGMGGIGGSWAGHSRRGGYSIAFVTGSMGTHDRGVRCENAVRAALDLPPLP